MPALGLSTPPPLLGWGQTEVWWLWATCLFSPPPFVRVCLGEGRRVSTFLWRHRRMCELVCAWAKLEQSTWLYFELSYLIIKSISKKRACVLKGAIVVQCLTQHGEWGDESHQKVEDCVLSWRSGWKWCLCDTCWHLRDLSCENKQCWLRTKSSLLYLHQKAEHVSNKVLYRD